MPFRRFFRRAARGLAMGVLWNAQRAAARKVYRGAVNAAKAVRNKFRRSRGATRSFGRYRPRGRGLRTRIRRIRGKKVFTNFYKVTPKSTYDWDIRPSAGRPTSQQWVTWDFHDAFLKSFNNDTFPELVKYNNEYEWYRCTRVTYELNLLKPFNHPQTVVSDNTTSLPYTAVRNPYYPEFGWAIQQTPPVEGHDDWTHWSDFTDRQAGHTRILRNRIVVSYVPRTHGAASSYENALAPAVKGDAYKWINTKYPNIQYTGIHIMMRDWINAALGDTDKNNFTTKHVRIISKFHFEFKNRKDDFINKVDVECPVETGGEGNVSEAPVTFEAPDHADIMQAQCTEALTDRLLNN